MSHGWMSGYHIKLMGAPRLRQLRVRPDKCRIMRPLLTVMAPKKVKCYAFLKSDSEEKDNFTIGWNATEINNKKTKLINIPWSYTYDPMNDDFIVFGKTGQRYWGGGYNVILNGSYEQWEATVNDLVSKGWLDERTRAIFLEFNLYSLDSHLYSYVSLLVERLPNGVFVPKLTVLSVHLSVANDTFFETLFFVLILICVAALGLHQFITLSRLGIAYFGLWFALVDLAIFLVGAAFIILFFFSLTYYDEFMQHFNNAQANSYIPFIKPLHNEVNFSRALGVLGFLAVIRLMMILMTSKYIHITDSTINRSKYLIVILSLTLFVLTLILASLFTTMGVPINFYSFLFLSRSDLKYDPHNLQPTKYYVFMIILLVLRKVIDVLISCILIQSYRKTLTLFGRHYDLYIYHTFKTASYKTKTFFSRIKHRINQYFTYEEDTEEDVPCVAQGIKKTAKRTQSSDKCREVLGSNQSVPSTSCKTRVQLASDENYAPIVQDITSEECSCSSNSESEELEREQEREQTIMYLNVMEENLDDISKKIDRLGMYYKKIAFLKRTRRLTIRIQDIFDSDSSE